MSAHGVRPRGLCAAFTHEPCASEEVAHGSTANSPHKPWANLGS